jgi:hypothetical protein
MTKTAQLAIARDLAETTVGRGEMVNFVLPGSRINEIIKGLKDDAKF